MGKLLQNERVKLYKKPSTWVLSGILVALILFFVVFIKIMNMLYGGSYSYSNNDWKSYYTYRMEEAQQNVENNPQDMQSKYDLQRFKYLLDNEVGPEDWRNDPAYDYFSSLASAESLEYMLSAGEDTGSSEEETLRQIEAFKKQAAQCKAVLDSGDWKDYIRLQIQQLQDGQSDFHYNDSSSYSGYSIGYTSIETPQERQVVIDILQMQIDMNIEPVPTQSPASFDNSESEDDWKRDRLNTLRQNKLSLLRGENTSTQTPLTSSAAAKLQQENAVIEEELRTNTKPIDPDNSFLGMLDSFTSNLNLITLLIIVFAGGIVASEFSAGTVKLLLITPHKRQKIFWAKALLLLEMTAIILGATFVLAFICSAIFNGFAGIGDMTVMSLFGQVVRLPMLVVILSKYVLYMLPVLTYGGLALMLSTVTRKSSVSIAVSLLLMYGSQIGMLLLLVGSIQLLGAPLPGMKFLLFANTDLSPYFPQTPGLMEEMMGMSTSLAQYDTTMSLGFSIVVLLVYLGCFLWIARDSFCRRDVK